MLPHERSLVAHMEGKPFVLLGVNCDNELETVHQVSTRQQINWRNWWNGGANGPYTAAYNVHRWPTTLVIDGAGVIRYRGGPGSAMEAAVEKWVAELQMGGRKG